jgi:hypothetical protein
VHWAAVRVDEASINARHVLFGKFLSARSERTRQGDSRLAHVLMERALVSIKRQVGETTTVPNLRARGKTATLQCSRSGPVRPDM